MDKNYILYEKVVEPIQVSLPTKPIKIIICCLIIILLLNVIQKVFKLDLFNNLFTVLKSILLIVIIFMIGLWTIVGLVYMPVMFGIDSDKVTFKEVNLSAIEKNIQVDGNKVIIDNLEDKYYYQDKLIYAKKKEKSDVEHLKRRVFKYDDFYDTKKLIDEDGNEFKLSEEDTKFLKERGVK